MLLMADLVVGGDFTLIGAVLLLAWNSRLYIAVVGQGARPRNP